MLQVWRSRQLPHGCRDLQGRRHWPGPRVPQQHCTQPSPGLTTASRAKMKIALGLVVTIVTRLGDLLHFGQLFKACGNNHFAKIAHIFREFS